MVAKKKKKTGRPRLYATANDRVRACRARQKAARLHQIGGGPAVVAAVDHADPVGELATWAAETLIVPPGHPRSGRPDGAPSVRGGVAEGVVGRA